MREEGTDVIETPSIWIAQGVFWIASSIDDDGGNLIWSFSGSIEHSTLPSLRWLHIEDLDYV